MNTKRAIAWMGAVAAMAALSGTAMAGYADDRAEIGINIRPPPIETSLGPQDGLYTRLLVGGDKAEARVIGAIRRVLDAERAPETVVAALADPDIDVVTMTVTEKGYCHVPASGVLDWERPEIVEDLARTGGRTSLPGLLVDPEKTSDVAFTGGDLVF